MGEIADMMLDGTMDPETGEFNFEGHDGPGFPVYARDAHLYRRSPGGHRANGRPPRSGPAPVILHAKQVAKLQAIGELRHNDPYHYQVRWGPLVLADWWPHRDKWIFGTGVKGKGGVQDFIRAVTKYAEGLKTEASQ